ncbi:hypothetical protein BDK92_0896 [Micromonospora pisi]|uniref:Uncharacterized protein n=1 Tax=Micromonospora pisi TaxID=589240 RepID=A0A495JD40_9ACTN|nr:hypothetical protein [Micromonospora pisi]RKR86651.1 hypothetical protein BDK92_0896 [Micromonospora pisi]
MLVLQGNPLAVSTVLLLILVVPICLYVFPRVLRTDPMTYVSHKYLRARDTFLPLAAMLANVVAMVVVLAGRLLG